MKANKIAEKAHRNSSWTRYNIFAVVYMVTELKSNKNRKSMCRAMKNEQNKNNKLHQMQ